MKKVLVTDWCLIEIGYLVSPLEDSSYFAFKILEVLIHTSLVLKIPSYFDEYSRELLPKSRTVPQIRHSFSQMPENYSIANPQILVTCPPQKKNKNMRSSQKAVCLLQSCKIQFKNGVSFSYNQLS